MVDARVRDFCGTQVGDDYVAVRRCPGSTHQPIVYEGRHTKLGYPVVIRFQDASRPGEVERELAALSRIDHGAVPQVLAHGYSGVEHSTLYLVRQLAPGEPLSVLLRAQQRLSPWSTVTVVSQIASALAQAHDHDVVHGDVKPENIVVDTTDGLRARLIDFGHALCGDESGGPLGTNRYLAPELLAGGRPSPASDVFALGTVLVECLLGHALTFAGQAVSIFDPRRSRGRGLSPDWKVPIPAPLRLVAEQATASDPELRFASAVEFALALESLDEAELAQWDLGGFPPGSRPDEPTHELPRSPITTSSNSLVIDPESLSSVARPQIWVFTGAPAMGDDRVRTALERIGRRVVVREFAEEDRFVTRLELQQGREPPPWVVVFSDFHVLLGDPLLGELSTRGETMRMLLSSHANLELAQTSIDTTGLDQHVCLPSSPDEIYRALTGLLERCARRRRYYDGLRLALMDASRSAESTRPESHPHR